MTKALYRRYRPETFQEVIGQEHVIKPLMAALAAGNTTHAYLFSGPRGCGKTTSARILARCLNCAEYPTDTPCGKCDSCRELAREGSGSLDVVELDAASHGGVDDARELREQAGFAPVRDRFKIYIIDEAHMVSNQGFNALLKLVEEPPPHVKFIFATTEPEKVIGTIRSRTHHYPFRLVPPATLENYLAQLCENEGVRMGRDVLSLVVRAGTGSVRDTLSVLDQIIGGSEGNVLDYDRAVALLGYTSAHLLDEAVAAIAARDGAALFTVVDSVVKSGHDPRRFVEDLLQRLRDVVIIALAGDSVKDVFLSVPDDQYALMVQQAETLGAARASRCADLVNDALTAMVGATAPRMQLELLCARLIVAGTAAAASSSDGEAPAIEAAGSVHNASDGRGGAERGGAQSAGAIQMRDGAGGFRKNSFSQLRGRSEERLDGRSGARSAPVGAAASAAVATPRDGAAKPTLADPRYQPMPSFTPEPAQAPAEKPTQSPVSEASAAEPAARQRAQTSQSPEHEMQNVPSYQPSAPPSGSTSAVPSGNSAPAAALDRVRAAWEQIVAQASAESKIAGNILKHATGVLAVEGGRVLVGFTDEGTASGFNHNKRAYTALAHALSQVVGAAVQTEGQVGAPASDARPKGDSANTAPNTDGRSSGHTSGEAATDVERGVSEALEAPEPLEELEGSGARGDSEDSGDLGDLDDSPELDPVYGLTEENDEPDPAGVLGQLLDSSEDSGAELESEGSKAAGLVPVEPGSMGPEAARPAVNSPVSLRSATASADVPFFEQEMPQLPPTELPASLARRYAVTESSAPHGEHTRAANAYGAHGNYGADSFAALREFREPQFPPDEPELHGEFRSKFRGEQGSQPPLEAAEPQFENPWDEVSADDPEISQSTLVGLNVVLAAFPGSEVAEVQNNNDDLA